MQTLKLTALLTLITLAVALLWPNPAQAQDVTYIPVDRDIYEAHYNAYGSTDEVCFHDVVDSDGDGTFEAVDSDGDGAVTKADGFTCTTTVVDDGTTINTHLLDLGVPPAGVDPVIAAIAYRNDAAGSVMSGLSNRATLILRPQPILLISGEFEGDGDIS